MNMNITRRHFLQTTAVGVTATHVAPAVMSAANKIFAADLKSRVIMTSHSQLVDASEQINTSLVRPAVDETLIALTGTTSIQDAWLALFPKLQSSDVIGIKVNCINRRLASHPEVVYALAQSLSEALQLNPNNLLIWDRTSRELKQANYTLNTSESGVRCLATSDGIGYDRSVAIDVGNNKQVRLSRILTAICTYLINVPVLKDHGTAGLTISLKNHYGSIDRPGSCHDGGCNPYIANLNNTPHIKEKTKLIFCDALFGIYSGGPMGRPQWINRQLLASTDPVALDSIGMTIIDQQRQDRKMSLVSKSIAYLRTAAELRLGAAQSDQIEHVPVNLG